MANEQELQDLIKRVVEAETNNFFELAKIAGLDPARDFTGSNLTGANLSHAVLSHAVLSHAVLSHAVLSHANVGGANVGGANVEGARFGEYSELSESTKHDLIERGAIFDDFPGDLSSVLTRP